MGKRRISKRCHQRLLSRSLLATTARTLGRCHLARKRNRFSAGLVPFEHSGQIRFGLQSHPKMSWVCSGQTQNMGYQQNLSRAQMSIRLYRSVSIFICAFENISYVFRSVRLESNKMYQVCSLELVFINNVHPKAHYVLEYRTQW